MKRLKIIANSLGIPNLLKEFTTSCIGLKEDNITIDVRETTSLDNKSTPNMSPWYVICNPNGPVYITVPWSING
jgi:hypothetical protein